MSGFGGPRHHKYDVRFDYLEEIGETKEVLLWDLGLVDPPAGLPRISWISVHSQTASSGYRNFGIARHR